jgi:Rne/Rng family ribonuclease
VSRRLLIAVSPGELWAALTEEGALVELRVLRPDAASRVGELHLGRVVALRPELPAALVDIGLDRPGFLSAEDAAPGQGITGLHEGQAVLVQVRKDPRADKAAGVSLRPRLQGRFLDLTPRRPGITVAKGIAADEAERLTTVLAAGPGEGFTIRTAAAGAPADALAAEVAALRGRWRAIERAARGATPPQRLEAPVPPAAALIAELSPDAVVIDDRAAFAEARAWLVRNAPELADRLTLHAEREPLFEAAGIASEIEGALAPRVPLPGSGALTIDITAAATMIDVDSGSGGALSANLAAAGVAARQIRLRNLSGPIVIDFIGLKRRGDRGRVLDALAAALANDPAGCEILGWTRLGHVELVRKRRHAPLLELMFERPPGGGLVKTAAATAFEALRRAAREAEASPARPLALHLHPEVAAVLGEGEARPARHLLEQRLGRPFALVAEPGRARDTFDIRPA